MPGNYSHTTRADGTVLTASTYNTDHQNHVNNMTPAGVDDHSANVAGMQATTDPGEAASESLPTSLGGEIERLRFVLKELKGGSVQWYESVLHKLTGGNGELLAQRDSANPVGINRTTNDGALINLRLDGTLKGSIGIDGDDQIFITSDPGVDINSTAAGTLLLRRNTDDGQMLACNDSTDTQALAIGTGATALFYNVSRDVASFRQAASEVFRYNTNGLLVGASSTPGSATTGVGLAKTGVCDISATGNPPVRLYRTETATNARILRFNQAAVEAGSINVDSDKLQIVMDTANAVSINTGTGSPEGAVTASVGSIYLREDGGASTTLYVKQSGTGNTGWVAK